MDQFTLLDIFVLLLVSLTMVRGFKRGLVDEILSLAAWAVGIIALKLFHPMVNEFLLVRVGSSAPLLAFILIFTTFFVGTRIIAARLGAASRNSFVGPIDRVLGGGFGLAKGVLMATLLFLAINLIYDSGWGKTTQRPQWMRTSVTYPLLTSTSRAIVDFVEARRNWGSET